MRVAALVDDLLDRSRITAALPDAAMCRDPTAVEGADVIVVDLARHAADVAALRRAWPDARIVAYGAHVDDAALDAARADGADVALPRSRFFHDPSAVVAPPTDPVPPSGGAGGR